MAKQKYLSNKTLLAEIIKCKANNQVSDELMKMLMLLTKKYATRSNFSGYSYLDDMISDALVHLSANALKFDPNKSENPFSYYTSCIHNSFIRRLNIEKGHQLIRDEIMMANDLTPSYSKQLEDE